jgi:hypothetical protein
MAKTKSETPSELSEVKSETPSELSETIISETVETIQKLDDTANLANAETIKLELPNPDEFGRQIQELIEANVLSKLFQGHYEQVTRALAVGNPARAEQWLKEGLTIVHMYSENVGHLANTNAQLLNALQVTANNYEEIIRVLQTRASAPPDNTWREAYERIATLENTIFELQTKLHQFASVKIDAITEKPEAQSDEELTYDAR